MGEDSPLILRTLGQVDYAPTWRRMQEFTAQRGADSHDWPDEIWLCEHPPVFTQGLAGKPEHLLADIGVPVVNIDRGGQITYHGPGQLVCYLLLDLKRRDLGIKGLVNRMEQAVIDLLAEFGVRGERLAGAPGVYVGGAKIAALGLKVKNGCCYHGLALNVAMDLKPFDAINPCGYAGMAVTQLTAFDPTADVEKVGAKLVAQLENKLREKP
ncbi:MAG: lipoyl(octanoyl) transferase LipB [Rhodocyclaceae bacterium]|nr:lipoyl(octanoyl) transferase LipB [Rhodocyclaceae bacterium]